LRPVILSVNPFQKTMLFLSHFAPYCVEQKIECRLLSALLQADAYEVSNYKRISVLLAFWGQCLGLNIFRINQLKQLPVEIPNQFFSLHLFYAQVQGGRI
jgi:hypothetical protein